MGCDPCRARLGCRVGSAGSTRKGGRRAMVLVVCGGRFDSSERVSLGTSFPVVLLTLQGGKQACQALLLKFCRAGPRPARPDRPLPSFLSSGAEQSAVEGSPPRKLDRPHRLFKPPALDHQDGPAVAEAEAGRPGRGSPPPERRVRQQNPEFRRAARFGFAARPRGSGSG